MDGMGYWSMTCFGRNDPIWTICFLIGVKHHLAQDIQSRSFFFVFDAILFLEIRLFGETVLQWWSFLSCVVTSRILYNEIPHVIISILSKPSFFWMIAKKKVQYFKKTDGEAKKQGIQVFTWSSRWWFQTFLIFTPDPWGNDPIWLVFFRWVQTTSQSSKSGLKPPTSHPSPLSKTFETEVDASNATWGMTLSYHLYGLTWMVLLEVGIKG